MTMYELSAKQAELTEMLIAEAEENSGAIPEELLNEMLDCDKDIDKKIENCAKAIKIIEAEADVVEMEIARMSEEISRLRKRRDSIHDGADRLRTRTVQFLSEVGKDKVKTPLFTVWIQRKIDVDIPDESVLPIDFKKQTVKVEYKPDTKLIREYLEKGDSVTGAELVTKESLRIR